LGDRTEGHPLATVSPSAVLIPIHVQHHGIKASPNLELARAPGTLIVRGTRYAHVVFTRGRVLGAGVRVFGRALHTLAGRGVAHRGVRVVVVAGDHGRRVAGHTASVLAQRRLPITLVAARALGRGVAVAIAVTVAVAGRLAVAVALTIAVSIAVSVPVTFGHAVAAEVGARRILCHATVESVGDTGVRAELPCVSVNILAEGIPIGLVEAVVRVVPHARWRAKDDASEETKAQEENLVTVHPSSVRNLRRGSQAVQQARRQIPGPGAAPSRPFARGPSFAC